MLTAANKTTYQTTEERREKKTREKQRREKKKYGGRSTIKNENDYKLMFQFEMVFFRCAFFLNIVSLNSLTNFHAVFCFGCSGFFGATELRQKAK